MPNIRCYGNMKLRNENEQPQAQIYILSILYRISRRKCNSQSALQKSSSESYLYSISSHLLMYAITAFTEHQKEGDH
jgi:hypothetical protein